MVKKRGKEPGWAERIMRGALRILLRTIAVILTICLSCVVLTGCFTGSLLLVDLIRARGGSYYEKLSDRVYDKIRQTIVGRAPIGDAAAQLDYLKRSLNEMRDAQLQTDEMLLAELDSSAYTLEEPLIVVNPYGLAPLSAVMLFQTERPSRIGIHIAGDTPLTEVDYDFSEVTTRHIIPVYGLYAGRENVVTVTATEEGNAPRKVTHMVQTDPLPDFLAHEEVRTELVDEAAYQPGFTFTYRGNNVQVSKAALDANGDYRWCLDMKVNEFLRYANSAANYNDANSVFLCVGNRYHGVAGILEVNLLGKLLNAWYSPYGVHHDIEVTGDTLWVTGSVSNENRESLVYALDRKTGEITAEIDYTNVLQRYRNQTQHYPEIDNFYSFEDWCHMNTVVAHGDSLIISSRHQSTVACSDQQGNLKWMLCDPQDYFPSFQRYILKPVGDGFTYFYTQHAPEVLPDQDGDLDTLDILLFDNGDFRVPDAQKASRMVQYRINERAMTVEQIWSYGDGVNETYSYRHGDADLLPNGNRLGSFEPYDEKADLRYAYGVEVNAEGDVVWECWRTSTDPAHWYGEYRLERLEIYADSANDLMLGVPATLFMPEEDGK